MHKKIKIGLFVNAGTYRKYKKLCNVRGLKISNRIEQLMLADVKKRLLELPELRL